MTGFHFFFHTTARHGRRGSSRSRTAAVAISAAKSVRPAQQGNGSESNLPRAFWLSGLDSGNPVPERFPIFYSNFQVSAPDNMAIISKNQK